MSALRARVCGALERTSGNGESLQTGTVGLRKLDAGVKSDRMTKVAQIMKMRCSRQSVERNVLNAAASSLGMEMS